MNKFSWSEVREFWEARSSHWEKTEHEDDPDALRAVVYSDKPLWWNKYSARIQEAAYQALFDLVPPPRPGARALDIGCGAGRWCRFLSEHGYQTVGIDLQPALIRQARHRYPHLDFLHTSVQDYSPEEPFDLVSSVEVLQHNPFEEQHVVIRKIRESLTDGGYVIMLEGAGEDPRPEAFYRPIDGWIEVFENSGFRNIAIQRYYYNLVIKVVGQLASMLRPRRVRNSQYDRSKLLRSAQERAAILESKRSYLRDFAERLVVRLDAPVESVLMRRNVDLSTFSPFDSGNCGFLFQAI